MPPCSSWFHLPWGDRLAYHAARAHELINLGTLFFGERFFGEIDVERYQDWRHVDVTFVRILSHSSSQGLVLLRECSFLCGFRTRTLPTMLETATTASCLLHLPSCRHNHGKPCCLKHDTCRRLPLPPPFVFSHPEKSFLLRNNCVRFALVGH